VSENEQKPIARAGERVIPYTDAESMPDTWVIDYISSARISGITLATHAADER
jgi:hypothetical protein